MTGDNFSDLFADYYVNNFGIYGDSEEGLEEAYADFTEGFDMSTIELEDEADQFADFYTELIDVYGDSEEGLEEAYADYMDLQYAQGDVDTYNDEIDEEFVEYYSEMLDVYGDNVEEAYADFYNDNPELPVIANPSSIDQNTQGFYQNHKGAILATGGAAIGAAGSYLATNKMRQRLQDLKRIGNRRTDAEDAEYRKLKMKVGGIIAGSTVAGAGAGYGSSRLMNSNHMDYYADKGVSALVGGAVGGTVGNGLGAMAAGLTDKTSGEIQTLKAKIKAGYASPSEVARYNDLTHALEKRIAKGALIGGVAGATLGAGTGYAVGKNFADDFADYYADNIDYYGDDVNSAIEDYYAEKGVSALVGGAVGGTAGTGLGAMAAGLTDKTSGEIQTLKAKIKAGYASPSEVARYNDLTHALEKRIAKGAIIGGLAGTAVGAGTGYAVGKNFADEDATPKLPLKDRMSKFYGKNKTAVLTAGGGVAGLGAGAMTASATDKDSAERNALKDKAKAGTITPQETTRLNELISKRKKRMMAGTLIGGAVGAAGAYGGIKGTEYFKNKKEKGEAKDKENSDYSYDMDRLYSAQDAVAGSYVSDLITGK